MMGFHRHSAQPRRDPGDPQELRRIARLCSAWAFLSRRLGIRTHVAGVIEGIGAPVLALRQPRLLDTVPRDARSVTAAMGRMVVARLEARSLLTAATVFPRERCLDWR